MPVLKNLESMIAGVVEGTFSRVFRSEVRPVEIARKLAREMEEHQYGTLSRTYVPNEYRVYLSPRDRDRFASYEDALADELAGYLLEHARRERFALLSRPVIEFETDERLHLGEFGIETAVVQPEEESEPAYAADPEPVGRTMVFSAAQRIAEPLEENATVRQQRALLIYGGRRLMVGPRGATRGRSRECEIVIDDANVSRQHAELRPRGAAWLVSDLGSTNGTRVNGRTINAPEVVRPGDEIEVGSSLITFELE
ncbi:MAG: FhaA domain-containing protein [Solirubrobacteraceae bacterium]